MSQYSTVLIHKTVINMCIVKKKVHFRQNKTKPCITELRLQSTQVYHAYLVCVVCQQVIYIGLIMRIIIGPFDAIYCNHLYALRNATLKLWFYHAFINLYLLWLEKYHVDANLFSHVGNSIAGLSNLRPTGHMRPARQYHAAREVIYILIVLAELMK